ncbi:hypothetical protein, partial [Mammaliicoccus lentus]|uniref:hypothetical protein n=1 Tax=Mammaliicoccus lentus TaxID=42858 RepID=UPI0019D3B5DF
RLITSKDITHKYGLDSINCSNVQDKIDKHVTNSNVQESRNKPVRALISAILIRIKTEYRRSTALTCKTK